MTDNRIDFRYLSEPDMVAAGVKDMSRCVDVMEDALVLLRRGDFRMAGPAAMSHGAMIGFPASPDFAGMPADGPDRRFMAMPAYLGGSYRTTGVKWYGSNVANRGRGLPRSIHLFMLNDSNSGAPLAVMSANLLSAYRTGAVPGVAVKHLARADARVFGIVGPGVIGRAVTDAVLTLRPGIDRLVVKGLDDAEVRRFGDHIRARFPQVRSVESVGSVEEVARVSDVMTVTVTTDAAGSSGFLHIDEEWIKPGALLLLPAAVCCDDSFLTSGRARLVVDSWRLYDAWSEEYGEQAYENLGIIGTHWHDLTRRGELDTGMIDEIADITTGVSPGRSSDDEVILYSAGGMPVEDVAWATDIYRRAVEQGIGVPLNLWDSPEMA